MSRKNRKIFPSVNFNVDVNAQPLPATDIVNVSPPVVAVEPPVVVEVSETPKPPVVKTTTYTVITITNHLDQFTEIVNNLLREGWQLQGGISTSHVSTDYNVSVVYTQALVKVS
jgi:hypothetical protein